MYEMFYNASMSIADDIFDFNFVDFLVLKFNYFDFLIKTMKQFMANVKEDQMIQL